MRIQSVRLGHANNSSSTHSILLGARMGARESNSGDFRYGWDWFHLTSKEDKAKYLAALLYSAMSDEMAPEHAALVARDLTGFDPLAHFAGEEYEHPYVDHQSVTVFPRKFGEKHLHHGFMRDFVGYVRDNPAITIRGGNDNDEDPGPSGMGTGPKDWSPRSKNPGTAHALNRMPRDERNRILYARKDGDWWALYDRNGGAKIRLTFNDHAAAYDRASRPELVDVKVTDHCPFNCGFCYQGSVKEGRHAKMDDIQSIAYAMRRAEVFEAAIGGGEPTLHPEFPKILEAFASGGVTPNFTTFSLRAWRDTPTAEAVRKHCRSFAVSNPAEVQDVHDWNEKAYDPKTHVMGPQATLQVPLGCRPEEEIRKALDRAKELHVPVTLLGYKHTGRGETFTPASSDWILDYLAGPDPWGSFGADSVFVSQFGKELAKRGVSEVLMVNREGAYSCYVDAVEMRAGASSFTKELHPVDKREPFNRFPYAA